MATKTANQDLFAAALAEVVAEPARPANAQRVADRRAAAPKPTAAKKARATVAKAQEAATQAAREGRTQGTQTGTSRTGRNGKVPCACQLAVDAETGKPIVAACGKDTWRTFAPGHDARLKGALIRQGLAGRLVKVGGAGDETKYSATDAAGAWGFREQVAQGIANPDSKLAKRARRAAKEDPASAVAQPAQPKTVTAKVGRWEYEGVVLKAGDGTDSFRYTDKKGSTKETGKFVLVGK